MTLKQSSAVHIPASYSADVILPGSSSKLRLLVINLASVPGGQLVNSPTAQSLGRWLQAIKSNTIPMASKYYLLFLFFSFLTPAITKGQITWDTTAELSRHEGGYGRFKPSCQAAVFYDGSIGIEVVRVKNNLSLVWLMNNTATKYYGIQWIANPNYKLGLFGFKAGGQVDFRFLHLGLGAIAQTDFKKLNLYVAPEAGLSWWGTVGVYYAFMIQLTKSEFQGSQKYQIGVKYNFTKQLIKEFKKGAG